MSYNESREKINRKKWKIIEQALSINDMQQARAGKTKADVLE